MEPPSSALGAMTVSTLWLEATCWFEAEVMLADESV